MFQNRANIKNSHSILFVISTATCCSASLFTPTHPAVSRQPHIESNVATDQQEEQGKERATEGGAVCDNLSQN